jgi:hypothetical protein
MLRASSSPFCFLFGCWPVEEGEGEDEEEEEEEEEEEDDDEEEDEDEVVVVPFRMHLTVSLEII